MFVDVSFKLKENKSLKNQNENKRIILKWILKKK